jgi:hypothetical protein
LLNERPATGEIDPDEYQRRREALEQRAPVGVRDKAPGTRRMPL